MHKQLMKMFYLGYSKGVFHPYLIQNNIDLWIMSCINQGTIMFDGNFEMYGRLLEDLIIDYKKNTCYMKFKKVYWADGIELTTTDLSETIKFLLHKDAPNHYFYRYNELIGSKEFKDGETLDIEGIRILSQREIMFYCKRITESFVMNFITPILPYHLHKDINIKDFFQLKCKIEPIGCGPYIYSYKKDNVHFLKRNNLFHLGKPFIDELQIIEGNENEQLELIEKKEIDFSIVNPDLAAYIKKNLSEIYDIYPLKSLKTTTISFNYNKITFKNVDTRRYLRDLISVEDIIKDIYLGYADKTSEIYPPLVVDKKLMNIEAPKLDFYEVNSDNVKFNHKLKIGYKAGEKIHERISKYILSLRNEIVDFEVMPVNDMYDAFIKKDIDLYIHDVNCYLYPYVTNMYDRDGSYVKINPINDEELFQIADNLRLNNSVIHAKELISHLYKNVSNIFLSSPSDIQIIRKGYENLNVDARGVLWNIHEIYRRKL